MDNSPENVLICTNPNCTTQLKGQQRNYCSEKCRSQLRRRVLTCASCKKHRSVIVYTTKRIAKLCRGCSVKLDRKKKSLIQQKGVLCKTCKFFLHSNQRKYCSEECRKKAYRVKVSCIICDKVRLVPKHRYLKGKISKLCVSCAKIGVVRDIYGKKCLSKTSE